MSVTVDRVNAPWIHLLGSFSEVLAYLKDQKVPSGACLYFLVKGNSLNCIYNEDCPQ